MARAEAASGSTEIERAAETIAGEVRDDARAARRARSRHRVGAPVRLKAENLQRTGSFKTRGALQQGRRASDAESSAGGVVAASAGNHAQAVAVAARSRGAPAPSW